MQQYYIPLGDERVELQRLKESHIQEMRLLSSDADIWTWYIEDLSNPDDLEAWMMNRLRESELGSKMSYAVFEKSSGRVVGSSSYGHIDWAEKTIEIGWTWLGKEFIGSGINKHMKYLMLYHAFSTMEIERLEFRTDEENTRSRRAMEKIGAKHDGTLRNHRAVEEGIR